MKAVGHVLLGKAELRRSYTVDIQVKVGRIDDLVHVNIDCAGNSGQTLTQVARYRIVSRIVALHLYVNRRGKPEIEDLRHHVGRLEEECEVREPLLQLRPQPFDISLSRTVMFLVERNQHLSICAADGCPITEGIVQGLRGQPDIVHDQFRLVRRNCLANLSSTWLKSTLVVSMRVPGLALMCNLICPASTEGKKSLPTKGTSRNAVDMIAMDTMSAGLRLCSTVSSARV